MALEKTKDLAWQEDVPQKPTTAQLDEIIASLPNNTANVNVIPYHVYSPNEQVVGEWQEMRDGVLKKKPVYEKSIIDITVPNNTEVNIGTIQNIDLMVDFTALRITFKGSKELAICPDSASQVYVVNSNQLTFYQTTSGTGVFNFVVRYTKTTDSWENV